MDLVKLLKSLEELLYELMVILVFFPRTLYLTFRYPQRMMDYADTELGDVLSDQYDDTLSPPLFLILCLALSHALETALLPRMQVAIAHSLLSDHQTLLAVRVFTFSLFPLLLALRLLQKQGVALNRESLRAPFYSQCFVTAPVAMSLGLSRIARHPLPHAYAWLADAFFALMLAWYLRQQVLWFRSKTQVSLLMSSLNILIAIMFSTALMAVVIVGVLLVSVPMPVK